ncbi:hypothetical protein [Algibacillus agarilyticus]|uniref:hypothetical protein n=1 Tax=Algibacillus agarilyticus TaxID=2234133 RepID=UPI000DCFA151|nr:hypothetical protein [Algibacillus agarilyticus]
MNSHERFKAILERTKKDAQSFEDNFREIINTQLNICKEFQGQYIPSDHGPGSWATTYSSEFIDAAAEIYYIFDQSYLFNAKGELSKLFKAENILSCRGSLMTIDRVEYLYETHLKSQLKIITANNTP